MKKEKKQHFTQSIPSPLERARVRLKICGMKYQDNIKTVANLQPDYLGFIFHEPSSRYFDGSIPELPKSIKKTGVFVDKPIEFIVNQIEKHNLSAIQLHGHESPEYCLKLKQLCHSALDAESIKKHEILNQHFDKLSVTIKHDKPIEIIKVFSIKDSFDFSVLTPYETVCDYFLFDTKGKLLGGNGYTFNWDVLMDYPSTKPFFLSGGIGLDEIDKLKEFKNTEASKYCYAIDVNSRFEIEPGLKNIEKLKEFKNKICHVERM